MDVTRDEATTERRWLLADMLIDGTGAPPRPACAVAIVGDRIEAVCDEADARIGPDEEATRLSGTLLPGLIDAHVHLVFDHGPDHALTRAAVEAASLPALTLRAARNAQHCLLAGVTTVRDCGDRGLVTLAVRDAIAAGLLTGPRMLVSGPPITTTAGHLGWCGGVADDKLEIRKRVRTLSAAGVDWIKVMASGGNMTAGSNPAAPQYSAAELAALVTDAHRLQRPVAAHSLNAETNRRVVAAGVDTVEHCAWAALDGGDGYDPALVRTMAERGTWVCLTLAGIDRELLPAADDPVATATAKRRQLRTRHADVRQLLAAGVPLIIGSDAGVRYSRFEDLWLSVACATLALDLTPVEAIHRVTGLAARALRLDAEVGTIAPGKRADLLHVEGNPALDLAALSRVRGVWRDGEEVVTAGRMRGPASIELIRGDR